MSCSLMFRELRDVTQGHTTRSGRAGIWIQISEDGDPTVGGEVAECWDPSTQKTLAAWRASWRAWAFICEMASSPTVSVSSKTAWAPSQAQLLLCSSGPHSTENALSELREEDPESLVSILGLGSHRALSHWPQGIDPRTPSSPQLSQGSRRPEEWYISWPTEKRIPSHLRPLCLVLFCRFRNWVSKKGRDSKHIYFLSSDF